MKRLLAIMLVCLMTVALFAGCGSTESAGSNDTTEKTVKVGIIQFTSHPSLDNCYNGIMEGLKASDDYDKMDVDLQNGNADSSTCDTIAANMVAKKYDIIFAIATPAATAAYTAAKGTDIPVVFCSVSDPVAAGIVEDLKTPGTNCTGTSDTLDLESQVSLIQAMQPDLKKIGVLYTTSEANSVSQLKDLKAVAKEKGLEIVDQGVQGASDIPQAAAALCSKVDAVNNFTDNNVVDNLSILIEQANANKIPVYGSEVEQVKNGCLASMSIDYVAVGKKTAEMGIDIMGGADITKTPVEVISDCTPVINSDVLEQFGMTVPDDYKDAETVTTNEE